MLSEILAISGKPGLYKYVSKGNRMILVETIDEMKKRMPAMAADKIVALSDISIYTDDDQEVPLATVFENIKSVYNGKRVDIHHKKASLDQIVEFFVKVLPNYDTDRVHIGDMRKVLQWYNILIDNNLDDFSVEKENEESKENKPE